MDADHRRACETCGAGLDGDQRYCLNCGVRAGARSEQLIELQRRVVVGQGTTVADSNGALAAAPEGSTTNAFPLRLPTPRLSALLVLVFLGFGTLLGSAAGSGNVQLAANTSPLRVVVPAGPATARATTTSAEASESPATEPEATPEVSVSEPASKSSSTAESSGSEKEAVQEGSGGGGSAKKGTTEKPATVLPPIKHVFVIMLDDEPYAEIFGPESKAHYLAGTLEKKGELLLHYDAVAHEQLANGIALVSGQGPTTQTAENCPMFTALTPGGVGADGQTLGSGCVYPSSTATIGDELSAKHLNWRAYIEGIDEPGASAGACAHPGLGEADASATAGVYATFRDPFVYFESVIASPSCASDVVGVGALKGDLATSAGTPSLSYIVPSRCHDGSLSPCSAGAAAGPADVDKFLETVVPQITSSKAYKKDGLLVITTDEAPSSGEYGDSSSCCGQPSTYPNLAAVEGRGHGGGVVGALLLSPFVPAAKTTAEPYDHYSLLKTIEDLFKVKQLGYTGLSAVNSLSPALFTAKG